MLFKQYICFFVKFSMYHLYSLLLNTTSFGDIQLVFFRFTNTFRMSQHFEINQMSLFEHSVFIVGRSVKDQFGNLAALHACPVRAFRRALELERDGPNSHFAHPLLSEVAQLAAVEYRRCRVERFRLNLDWVLEVYMEGVAGTIAEEFCVALCEDTAYSFEFNFYVVISSAVRGTVQTKSDDEYSTVDRELYAVAAAAVSPLVGAVCT